MLFCQGGCYNTIGKMFIDEEKKEQNEMIEDVYNGMFKYNTRE